MQEPPIQQSIGVGENDDAVRRPQKGVGARPFEEHELSRSGRMIGLPVIDPLLKRGDGTRFDFLKHRRVAFLYDVVAAICSHRLHTFFDLLQPKRSATGLELRKRRKTAERSCRLLLKAALPLLRRFPCRVEPTLLEWVQDQL